MQEKKRQTKPVRIDEELLTEVEQIAIEESTKRGELLTVPQMVTELIQEGISNRDAEHEK